MKRDRKNVIVRSIVLFFVEMRDFVSRLSSKLLKVECRQGIVRAKYLVDVPVEDCSEYKPYFRPPLMIAAHAVSIIEPTGRETEYFINKKLYDESIFEGQHIRFKCERFLDEMTILEIFDDIEQPKMESLRYAQIQAI